MPAETTRTCLYVNNSPEPGRGRLAKLGGGGKSLLSILKRLPEAGWKSYVVVPGEGQFTDVLGEMGIPHLIFPYGSLSWRQPIQGWRTFSSWRRLIRQIRPDIIHANGFDLSRSFGPAAASLGVPFVTHVRFPVPADGVRWVLRGLPKPAGFIFNSRALHDRIWPEIAKLAPRSKDFVVHNAVDLSEFQPSPPPAPAPLRVGIIANFAPFKRHEDFLRMAAIMVRSGLEAEFWIVGDDTEGKGRKAQLVRLAEELGLTGKALFLGHRNDIPQVLSQLHVLVLTSSFEPFGRVVIEAMACGRPVVATRDGGVPEIVDHGETGYLVDVADCEGMAAATAKLLQDRALWERMSRSGAERARRCFSLEAHVAQVVNVYNRVLAPGR